MLSRRLNVPIGLLAVMILAVIGCAPSSQGLGPTSSERTPAGPNVLRVAVTGDSHVFHERLKPVSDNPAGAYVNAGLATLDHQQIVRPLLLERLPTQDDGSWIVNPDGTMKTLLTLRPDLKWQDGPAPHVGRRDLRLSRLP